MPISLRADRVRWGMVALLIVAFAVRVSSLTFQSLWRDEVDALRFATAPWPELLGTFTKPGWNGPLYFALLRGWIALTGRSAFALRYFSLLAGVAAVALAFALARRLSDRLAAFLCASLFALSPYFIWYSQETKMYALILALVTLAIYALRRAMDKGSAAWWATLVVATSLAVYCHILAALIIPVEMILALVWGLESRNGGWWKGALASFACLTLPYLPLLRWELPLVFSPAQTGYTFYPLDQMLLVMLNGFATGISGLLAATTLWPSGILLLVGAVMGAMSWRNKAMLVVWLLLPPLVIFLISLNRPIFTDRYLIWIGPAFYLLVALGGAALWKLWRPLGLVAILAVVGVAANGANVQATTPIKSDVRDAARYFEAHSAPGDLVIFQIPYLRYTFNYYDPHPYEWADGLFTNYGMSDAEVDAQMRTIVAGHKTIWLVASEMTMWDSRLQVWHWLESHAQRTDAVELAQVTLYRYELQTSNAP
jgi:mannosyltransferase